MLLEFRVKNFRSLHDEQVLSLVASKDKTLHELNTLDSGLKSASSVLRSAVLYGPNAGGKSNVIKALQYMRAVVIESANKPPGQEFNVKPFLLNTKSSGLPTEFEVTLILDGVRHQYGFTLNSQRIVCEYLLVYKAAKPQQWFKRDYDSTTEKYVYEFSSSLKGKKNVWESSTRENSLFLSMAVQLNSEQLRPVFGWFNESLTIVNDIERFNPQFSVDMLKTTEGKKEIYSFLSSADISISDIEVVTQKVPSHTFRIHGNGEKPDVELDEKEIHQFRFQHTTENGEAVFDLTDESTGTRNLLFLAGPILDMLKNGRTIVVDELDNSLHPLLVRRLVELFHSPTINTHGAQLIFSTHDTSLLNPDLFRRDQVWFVEKNHAQESRLYPLSDFSPRKNEAIEHGYLIGRYGALPFFNEPSQGT